MQKRKGGDVPSFSVAGVFVRAIKGWRKVFEIGVRGEDFFPKVLSPRLRYSSIVVPRDCVGAKSVHQRYSVALLTREAEVMPSIAERVVRN